MSESVCHVLFVPRGQTICLSPGGQTFLSHRRGGDKHFSHTGGDKHFCILWMGTNIFASRGGGQTFFVGGGSGYDDVDEEINVSEANIFVSEVNIFVSGASKLSAGTRIFRVPYGPEILAIDNCKSCICKISCFI